MKQILKFLLVMVKSIYSGFSKNRVPKPVFTTYRYLGFCIKTKGNYK